MAAANYYSAVQKAYIAFYGRPADKVGLEYWAGQLDTANGNLSTIINAFGTSTEALGLFGSQTDTVAINSLYQQLFGRSADVEGLVYYGTELAAGRMTLVDIAQRIADGATGSDATTIANKLTVAQSFTDALDTADEIINYSGTAAATSARTFLSGVTDDTATVTTATAAIPATLTSIVTVGDTTTTAGSTFTLTTGTNSFTGTAGDDTFDAGISTSSLQTFNSGDSLDGGAGNDILYAVVTGSVTPAAVKNVETVNLTNTTTAATVDLSNATGLSAVNNSASTVGLTISGISSSGPTVTVRDTTIAGQVVVFNDVTGSADSATVVLNNMGSGSTLTVAGVETLTLQSEGNAANVLTTLTTANTAKLIVSGSIGLNAGTLGSTITTLDASANTSTGVGITAIMGATGANTITGSAGNDSLTIVSTGADSISADAGNDTIWYSTGTWATTDSLDGGDGTDTLRLLAASVAGVATPTTYATTNIETVQITDALAAATYTPANISATATTLNVTGNTDNAGATITTGAALSVTNAIIAGPAGSFAVGLGTSLATNTAGVLAAGGNLTINDTGTATTDSLTITNNAKPTSGSMLDVYNGAVLAVNGYETVTINTGSTSGATNDFASITVTGDAGGTSAETVKFTGSNIVLMAGVIAADIVDASGLTAAGTAAAPTLTMVTGSTATTVTGSAGRDILFGNTSSASSIDAGAGADTVTGGTGNDTIIGGDGNDSITAGSGNDSIDAGAGDDTIVMAANLASGDVVNGGEGTDTLLVSAAIAAAAASTITSIELVGFSATASQDMTAFLNAGVTTLAATAGTLTVTNAQTDLTSLVVGVSGAGLWTGASVTRLVDGSADALSILVVDGSTAPTVGTASFADEETLTIGESGTDSTSAITVALGTVTATDLKTLNITGSNNHSMTLSGETALATVNASTATGTLNIAGGNSAVNMIVTGPASTAMSIVGGAGNDSITGGVAADSLAGGAGSDTLIGGTGADTLVGGKGADSIVGGGGSDSFSAVGMSGVFDTGGSLISSGAVINLSSSSVTAANILAYAALTPASTVGAISTGLSQIAANTAGYLGATAVDTNFSQVSAVVDTLDSIEYLIGSGGADVLIGSSSADSLSGGAGADYISGGAGADTIVGGAGYDYMTGGAGANRYDFTTDGDASATTITVTNVATGLAIANTDTISTLVMDELAVIAGDTLFLGNVANITIEDGIGNVNTVDGGVGTITLAGTANVAYIKGTLSGSTFTVDSTSTTGMMIAWDGDGGDTTAENYVVLTGTGLGTPTLALGVLTIV